ncbi:hypothetical protein EW145_g1631 [Phellinidium pouzarii]|uniref:Uncharacterized protein n=1 Tax=Phellinidium pouzarii TaxID=167371 RepID=A0A4V3XDK3_9AGAM|nr:hypothetical protein EW145_g1631 [Phellinidium pouzarii]
MTLYQKTCPLRRNALFAILGAFTCLILFKGMHPNKSQSTVPKLATTYGITAHSYTKAQNGTHFDGMPESSAVEITGYWKEVRASLGLAPLLIAIAVEDNLAIEAHDEHDLTRTDKSNDSDEQRQQRLGRLNLDLRRRRLLFSAPAPRPTSSYVVNAVQYGKRTRKSISSRPTSLIDGTNVRFYADLELDADMDEREDNCEKSLPQPFLAPEIEDVPRMPVRALSASFRAIAARELKAKPRRRTPSLEQQHTDQFRQ